jgi:hypothetical protein
MKIGGAHLTQSSSLFSANTIGALMHPAPIGVADQTRKKKNGTLCLVSIAYWRGGHRSANILPLYWRSDVPFAITKCYNSE